MYLDFEENHPDTPRFPAALTRLEAALITALFYAVMFIAYLLAPKAWFEPAQVVPADVLAQEKPPIRFVEVAPLKDVPAPPKPNVVQSDLDRRAMTREKAPKPENTAPFSAGITPEKIEGGPQPEKTAGPPSPSPTPPQPATPQPPPPPEVTTKGPINEGLQIPRAAAGNLGDSLRNLQRYLHDQNYDNQQGGQADTGADIQFDSMGVDFGPWLRRFKNQIERNWLVPQAAMSLKGRVVIQFWVLRNGSIVDMKVVQPSEIAAFTTSALNALKLSNPTTPLPPEYPADKVLFTVTFHYNEFVRDDR